MKGKGRRREGREYSGEEGMGGRGKGRKWIFMFSNS